MSKKRSRKDASGQPKVEEEMQNLTFEELRTELLAAGLNPGPIDSSNKEVYIRKLIRKKAKLDEEKPEEPSFPPTAGNTSPLARRPITGRKKQSSKPAVSSSLAVQSKKTSFDLKGLLAAPFTPFTDDGEVNLPVIKKYTDFLCEQGVMNAFVCGTTGEGMSMSLEERQLVTEEWIKASRKRMKIIVHVGSENLKNCCELAAHAVKCGADAIAAVAPSYYKPPSLESLVLYLEKIAEAAPSLPMFYYHIPTMTGVNFSMEELLDMASSRLPTLRGIKYTHENLLEFSRCVAHSGGKYLMMYGRDEQVLGSLSMGATAAVGSTYNYSGKLNNRIFAAFARGDMELALLEQRRSQAAINLLLKYGGGINAGKAFMRMRGLDVGPPRLPLLPLSAEEYKNLQSDLDSIGFFGWA